DNWEVEVGACAVAGAGARTCSIARSCSVPCTGGGLSRTCGAGFLRSIASAARGIVGSAVIVLVKPASRAGAGAVLADRAGDGGWLTGGCMVVVGVADDGSGSEGAVTMATFH